MCQTQVGQKNTSRRSPNPSDNQVPRIRHLFGTGGPANATSPSLCFARTDVLLSRRIGLLQHPSPWILPRPSPVRNTRSIPPRHVPASRASGSRYLCSTFPCFVGHSRVPLRSHRVRRLIHATGLFSTTSGRMGPRFPDANTGRRADTSLMHACRPGSGGCNRPPPPVRPCWRPRSKPCMCHVPCAHRRHVARHSDGWMHLAISKLLRAPFRAIPDASSCCARSGVVDNALTQGVTSFSRT